MNKLYREMVIAGIRRALAESKAADQYDNTVLKGRAREIFVAQLLRPYLNPTMGICTGIVIDPADGHSCQMDVIVFDKNVLPPSLLQEGEEIIPYESVLATIEVKTRLTSEELRNSIRNARSVKNLEPLFVELRQGEGVKSSPVCYVFAFTSDLAEKPELERLTELVKESNEGEGRPVKVPLSGICIAGKDFVHCRNAEAEPPVFCVDQSTTDYEAILLFLVHVLEATNHLSLQRQRISIGAYLLG